MSVIRQTMIALTIAVFAYPAFADTAPEMNDTPRLAIGGYDTVAYFTVGKAVPGNLEYQTVWHDARWQFANKADLDLFIAEPEKYAAQYDGHCAMGVAYEDGHTIRLIQRHSQSSTENCTSIILNTGPLSGVKMKVKI